MKESRVYLDTSIITKRYIKEENGDIADSHFHPVQCGETVITLSEINLGGAAAVFDKYSRKMGIDARVRLQTTVSELISLERSSSVEIYPVSRHIIQNAIRIVLEQHIYISLTRFSSQLVLSLGAHYSALLTKNLIQQAGNFA